VTDALDTLPVELQLAVRSAVRSDEHVLWACQPDEMAISRENYSLAPIVFGMLFVALGAAFVGIYVWRHRHGAPASALVLVIAVGLLFLGSRFMSRFTKNRFAYILTNSRALVVGRLLGKVEAESFMYATMGEVMVKRNADGSGDLVFRNETQPGKRGGTITVPHGFLAIADVAAIEGMLRKLRFESLQFGNGAAQGPL
jgi:hypothetical protein